jgi:hypothetical protein
MPLTQYGYRDEHISGTARETAYGTASLNKQIAESLRLIQQSKAALARPDRIMLGPRPQAATEKGT